MTLQASLTYEPVELAFGTSGLRGLVRDMTDLECYINTAGFLRFLADNDGLRPKENIYIAGDLRATTPRIMQAVMAAIIDGGYQPLNCGKIPTPALAYYALEQQAPCIMITGSHIPADRNGIKFYKRGGEILKPDEAPIQAAVQSVRDELYSQTTEPMMFDRSGAMKQLPVLGPIDTQAESVYKRRYLDVFPADSLAGVSIVVYQQGAVVRDLLVEVFEALGATVLPIERSDEFIPIDTDKITDEEKMHFRGFAEAYPDSFAIISADGDSDRPIVIDETGVFQWGDLLGAIVAPFLGAKFAATVITANDAVDGACAEHHIPLVKTKIGSPYVIAAMAEAPPDERPAVAWELNGGFLLGDQVALDGKLLKPLPTRDALLPILACLVSARRQKLSVSALFQTLPKRYAAAELTEDVSEARIATFRAKLHDLAAMQTLARQVFTTSQLGPVTKTDITDGLRLTFASGDILHFRPSGNAPQFRVYSNADSQTHATELVKAALTSGGYLEQLLAAFGI